MVKKFCAEEHFELKIKQGSIRDQSIYLRFGKSLRKDSKFIPEKGIKRIVKDNFKFEEFKEINKLHNDYLDKLKGQLHPNIFQEILYKAELTGAKIEIANKEGYVIEDRKNTLTVIFENDIIKVYSKQIYDFSLVHQNVKYMFYSGALKAGRLFKS